MIITAPGGKLEVGVFTIICIATIALFFGLNLWMGVLFLCVLLPYTLVWWFVFGKTIVLDEEGCTIKFFCFQKRYLWSDFQTKQYAKYSGSFRRYSLPYASGAEFCLKSQRKKKTMGFDAYSFFHPWTFFFVFFSECDSKDRIKMWYSYYVVNESEFRSKLQEWGVEMEEVSAT